MRIEITTPSGPAVVELDRPRTAARALLMITHGSGGTPDTADVLAVRDRLLAERVAIARVTQPYVVAGRRTPPVPATQDAAWLATIAAVRWRRGLGDVPLIVSGRSNGARVAARTAPAAGASAVLALAYPLHPPGKPEASRLDELDAAGVPTLVVQGARDPFGLPPAVPGRQVVVIPAADHSLKRDPDAVAAAAAAFVTSVINGESV
jgi:uncharacterized protein